MNATGGASGGVGVLCLGEVIVDLICEREAESLAQAGFFRPHVGGALANVAVACRRAGAPAALLSGAGEDSWGTWIRDSLEREGVGLRWFELVPGAPTAVAFAIFGADGEPTFQVYGEGIRRAMDAVRGHLDAAIAAASALVFGSNTLVSESERSLTLGARQRALDGGLPILFDPNLRPTRWWNLDEALALCRDLADGAFCIRANREEAKLLTGEREPAAAAEALCGLGAKLAVVTLGPDGALVRGAASAEAPGVAIEVVSTLGAGDAFMGTMAANLAAVGWDPGRAGDALPAAVAASAETCKRWSAWG